MTKRGYIMQAQSVEWETPQWLFDRLNEVFRFNVDAACTPDNCKCTVGFTIDGLYRNGEVIITNDDSLSRGWGVVCLGYKEDLERVFCNPPYGYNKHTQTGIEDWIRKAHSEVENGNAEFVVMLIPSSTEMTVWHDTIFPSARYILFLKGRLSYEINGKKINPAGKGSAVVVFSREDVPGIEGLEDLGKLYTGRVK